MAVLGGSFACLNSPLFIIMDRPRFSPDPIGHVAPPAFVEQTAPPPAAAHDTAQDAPSEASLDVGAELGRPRGVAIPIFCGGLGLALLVGLILGGMLFGSPDEKEAQASKEPPKAAAVKPAGTGAAKPPPKSLAELALGGDKQAIKKLRAMPQRERTAEQSVALARVRANERRAQIAEIGHKIALVQDFGRQEDTKKKIMQFAKDREIAADVLLTLAKLPKPIGPDYLYKVLTRRGRKSPTKELAEDLLYSKDVRAKASDELNTLLDLRHEKRREQKDCQKVLGIMERAQVDADARLLTQMGGLFRKRGCGPDEREDCWPCLRGVDVLKQAAVAASKRKAPL